MLIVPIRDKITLMLFVTIFISVTNTFSQTAKNNNPVYESRLTFQSSDINLVKAFDWAKQQAMAFVFENDPVGPWYEAAEPGREAFCMRDVAHQSMGAHALGLSRHNLNMLKLFAENISDARDWCSLWEIDRFNRPAPVDYKNDSEFWYNLPANFDVLDACYRMYLWSGDLAYVKDPIFLNYYDRTVTDYVERWGLGIDQIMRRPRLMNVRGMSDPGKKFRNARGIPGYNEQNPDYTLGMDVVATQYAGYKAYAYIQEVRGNEELAKRFKQKAEEVKNLVNNVWWNENEKHFYSYLDANHKLTGNSGSSILYRGVVDEENKINSALNSGRGSVEVLYQYGNRDSAYVRLINMANPGRSRLDYPEVSYSWIGALVNGTMGVTLIADSPLESAVKGFWVEVIVRTEPKLSSKTQWAELKNLPIRANEITVRHEGLRKTVFTNQSGPAVIWQAAFPGTFETLLVNERTVKANNEKTQQGTYISWVNVTVGSGNVTTVEIAK